MQTAAAVVMFTLGFLHSVLGEWRMFIPLSRGEPLLAIGFPPIIAGPQSAFTIAIATRGKHLGWVGFSAAAVLVWLC